jgi:hypothetical protein
MIIGCPKCGFEQPKIEYCANCGVDMRTFKPKKLPLKDRLFRNSYFYIALMILVFIATSIFVKENWFPSEKRVYTFVPASYQEIVASEEDSHWSEEDTEAVAASNSEEPRAPASDTNAKTIAEAPSLQVYIASIPVSSLAYIIGQELTPESLKEFRSYGIRRALEAKDLTALEDTTVLYSLNYMILAQQDPLVIQQYLYDSDAQDELGFKLTTAVDSYRNDQLIFVMRLTQNFYTDKAVERQDHDLRVEIGEKQTRIITGVLPHKALNAREKALLQSGYLGLMNSPEFQSSEQTFIIVLTYKY